MDLRIPSGIFFLSIGIILLAVGLIGTPPAPLTDINVNLYSGLMMALFGGVLLWLAKKQPQ
jgi:hypothetical protein